MKIDIPTNLCKNCYQNLSVIKMKHPITKKVIEVCDDCYDELYEIEVEDKLKGFKK